MSGYPKNAQVRRKTLGASSAKISTTQQGFDRPKTLQLT
jgi:hypothetical protein